MDNGEPPGRRPDEESDLPEQPTSDEGQTTPAKAARVGIVATLPHSPKLKEYFDRAVHDELWAPEGPDGMRISLATHSTSVISTRGEAHAKLLITLSPRSEHRERVIETVHGIVSKYANSVQGVVHGIVEDEEQLRRVATGKAGEL